MISARHLAASLSVTGAVLCAASAAAVARDTGSLVRPSPAQAGDDSDHSLTAARKTMYAYAVCALKLNRNGVISYLDTFPGSQEAAKRADRLAVNDCLDLGELTFSEEAFRGAAYQALYRQNFTFKAVDSVATQTSPDYRIGADLNSDRDLQAIALRQFSECVVRANPSTVHSLTLSVAGSVPEERAFGSLGPNLSACLPKGRTLAFTKNRLRNVLGEVLYRVRLTEPTMNQGQK